MAKGKVKKYKQKPRKAVVKRFKKTGTGKIKARGRAFTSHNAPRKTTKQKRQLRKKIILKASEMANIGAMLSRKKS